MSTIAATTAATASTTSTAAASCGSVTTRMWVWLLAHCLSTVEQKYATNNCN